ncbi:MAG TPA: radical SAM protein, partial [Candidatus Omnitrophota bacterium]|nr:radical SAM protein [Candidatus Omnitrophota bacterium]
MENGFYEVLKKGTPDIKKKDINDILLKEVLDEKDFLFLLSDKAVDFLENIAKKSNELTLRNFGRVISLYAPLYLSNYCENECVYCGFSRKNQIKRKKLSIEELIREAGEVEGSGIQHILLLTGESRKESPVSFIKECVEAIKKRFSSISIEVYPLSYQEYKELFNTGVDGLTLYQETYDEKLYSSLHLAGPKRDFANRLLAPELACRAGMRQVNIGSLLGLGDWRQEAYFTGLHARWLMHNYPEVEIGVSLPRFKKHEGAFSCANPVSDKEFVQILIALRLF